MENIKCINELTDLNLINESKERLISNQSSFTTLSNLLTLACDTTKLKIIYLLTKVDDLCACDLKAILEINESTIFQHLNQLIEGNVIESYRKSLTTYYTIKGENLKLFDFFDYPFVFK